MVGGLVQKLFTIFGVIVWFIGFIYLFSTLADDLPILNGIFSAIIILIGTVILVGVAIVNSINNNSINILAKISARVDQTPLRDNQIAEGLAAETLGSTSDDEKENKQKDRFKL